MCWLLIARTTLLYSVVYLVMSRMCVNGVLSVSY